MEVSPSEWFALAPVGKSGVRRRTCTRDRRLGSPSRRATLFGHWAAAR